MRRVLAASVAMVTLAGCAIESPTQPTHVSTAPAAVPPATRSYPEHTRIVATTFWVGEVFDPDAPDGSQVCSAYDSQWAYHWSGIDRGRLPKTASACPGARLGGCDGVLDHEGNTCETEPRTAANDYFPRNGRRPLENPFYLDLPYDDLNDPIGFARRCAVVPWAADAGYSGRCTDRSFSYLKNRWVAITGPNGRTCYGQIEDAGPSHDDLYHDAAYVFGTDDVRPAQHRFNNAGLDVSPALNGCLGFADLDGDSDRVSWRFADDADVPDGPWRRLVTKSGVTR